MKIDFISAETHTPEYLMHKYWARKPHNVISKCLESLVPKHGVIIDPFCGSGVTLREGALLGHDCYGFDVNPTAFLISSILTNPPQIGSFISAYQKVYDAVYDQFGCLYKQINGEEVRYVSHRIVAKCSCGKECKLSDCTRVGKKTLCPSCGKTIHFNLESLCDTEVFNINGQIQDSCCDKYSEELSHQKELSSFKIDDTISEKYNFTFPENRRILAFNGIKTADFFTNRNFSILCAFAEEIYRIEDSQTRNSLLLLLTASAAQCSRLIAHRNNLTTGGPAWSVPGFWVPLEHLETNPFVHIQARFKKFVKALNYLVENPIKGTVSLNNGDSLSLLEAKEYKDLKADIIFLDPPYGDSVPYTEFSNIWNSFLRIIPNSDEDISVSDRMDKKASWSQYREKLNEFMRVFSQHLKPKGKLLITFNNNDMRAWESLLFSLQNNHFKCDAVFYQIPAVISSKAMMSPDSSYISDIYSVYSLDTDYKANNNLTEITIDLVKAMNARDGVISKICADRVFIISWIKNNINCDLLKEKDNIINSVATYDKDEKKYKIRPDFIRKGPRLSTMVPKEVHKILEQGPVPVISAYKTVSAKLSDYGTMELTEFNSYLEGFAIHDGKIFGAAYPTLF